MKGFNINPVQSYVDYLRPITDEIGKDYYVVRTPDIGSIPRAINLAKSLDVKISLAKN